MPVFNSRDPIYRSPTGAVADGTRVHFKISVPRNMRCSAAYMLMQAVDSKHFRMYWQPNQYRTEEENLKYAALLAPFTEHLHVFNWEGAEKHPLGEAVEQWQKYLACFPGDRCCLLEFMPDNRLASLQEEARALREIVNG